MAGAVPRALWSWPHAHYLDPSTSDLRLDEWLAPLPRALRTNPALRALAMVAAQRRFSVVVVGLSGLDNLLYLTLRSLFPSRGRNVVILHFIPPTADAGLRGSTFKQLLKSWWVYGILRRVVQRNVLWAQCLTSWEARYWAERFDAGCFEFVPYPMTTENSRGRGTRKVAASGVMVSGRASCDWPGAADILRQIDEPVRVVCGQKDATLVRSLDWGSDCSISVDVAASRHEEMVRDSAVYLLCLVEDNVSSGHIRAGEAIRNLTPIVATRVASLRDYLNADDNALLFDQGDAAEGTALVRRLLGSPDERSELASRAIDSAQSWTWDDYRSAIRNRIAEVQP